MTTHKEMLFVLAVGLAVLGHVTCRVIRPVYVHKRHAGQSPGTKQNQAPTIPTLKVASPAPLPATEPSSQNRATSLATVAIVNDTPAPDLRENQKPTLKARTSPAPIRVSVDEATTANPASSTGPSNRSTTQVKSSKGVLAKSIPQVAVKNKSPKVIAENNSVSVKVSTIKPTAATSVPSKSGSAVDSKGSPPSTTKGAMPVTVANISVTTPTPTTTPPTTRTTEPLTTEPEVTEGVEAEETEPTPGAGEEAEVTEAPEIEETDPTSGPEEAGVTEEVEVEETEGPTPGAEVKGGSTAEGQSSGLALKAAGRAAIADASRKGKVQPAHVDPLAGPQEVEEPEATG
ncbi:mucin-2-like [Liolophura sinensis]|uniref:mucin-2-like n=1 Tax=Liolophura sinensis TaxID=3198878 RepID=UPI0031584FDF